MCPVDLVKLECFHQIRAKIAVAFIPHIMTCLRVHYTATEFLIYLVVVASVSLYLIFRVSPEIGHQNILVDLVICSLVGSIRLSGFTRRLGRA